MALGRSLAASERVAAGVALLLGVISREFELLRRVARRGADRGVGGEEERGGGDRGGRQGGGSDPLLREREDDEPERERGECGAGVRVEERDVEKQAEQAPPRPNGRLAT